MRNYLLLDRDILWTDQVTAFIRNIFLVIFMYFGLFNISHAHPCNSKVIKSYLSKATAADAGPFGYLYSKLVIPENCWDRTVSRSSSKSIFSELATTFHIGQKSEAIYKGNVHGDYKWNNVSIGFSRLQ